MTTYQQIIQQLQKAFPPPVSDPVHDGYVVFSMLRALDQVDALKSEAPMLGSPTPANYEQSATRTLQELGTTLEQVTPELVRRLQGMLIWGHPQSQMNVITNASIASIIGVLLPSMFNPNLVSDESGLGFSEAEVEVVAMIANLVGMDSQQAGGLFTFGGTGATMYGAKIGLEKASPGAMQTGLRERAVIIASEQSHYACLSVAGWLGLGHDNVLKAPTHRDNSINLHELRTALKRSLDEGAKVAAIIATMGTTDAFGVDDLRGIHEIREELVSEYALDYTPHIHADAVIGWAWSVFNDYEFDRNNLGFRGRTVRTLAAAQNRIKHLALADSIGVDFHKTGYTPYVSSLFLLRDRNEFSHLSRDRATMPYLYHGGEYHPGMFSLETSRSALGPMSALANLLLFGKQGLRALMGNAVEMAETLREQIGAHSELTVLNDQNHGTVTLFRAYPKGVDTFREKDRELSDIGYAKQIEANNEFNRRIHAIVHEEAMQGNGVAIGFTDCYRTAPSGAPICALKSFVLSPFTDSARMQVIVDHVLAAKKHLEAT